MDTINYDFESTLEQGFKTLFADADLALRIPDDAALGELPDESLTIEIDTGGPLSDEHQSPDGIYDHYAGNLSIEIHTPRVSSDQVQTPGLGHYNRHRELVARTRKTLDEIDAATLAAHWPANLVPTKIIPTGTERESDARTQSSRLSYTLHWCIT